MAIHLNDTHPALAIPELMRLLIDDHRLPWDEAWSLCTRIFSYTNHTLMAEALETWPVDMMGRLLPRHLRIIFDINARFLASVHAKFPDDPGLLGRVSLIDENGPRRVRMAYLSVLASHKVNGVSRLHSELIVKTIFADFARIFPDRFCNKTNGITPRRWLGQANPPLAALIDSRIGTGWRRHLGELAQLRPLADDAEFRSAFRLAKQQNKLRLVKHITEKLHGPRLDPQGLFDVQVKRMHEYKRQLLNVLHVITRYHRILSQPQANWVPRTVLFAGKAASAYYMAKLVIQLINDVARVVNADKVVGDRLKVVFLPDYRVSLAEIIIPAADLSEQISTAGTEASGTGNMKLALERRAHHRHLGRREHRDRRAGGAGEHLHLRQPHRAGGGAARERLRPQALLPRELRPEVRDRPPGRRRVLARRAGPLQGHRQDPAGVRLLPCCWRTMPITSPRRRRWTTCIACQRTGRGAASSTWRAWACSRQTGRSRNTRRRSGTSRRWGRVRIVVRAEPVEAVCAGASVCTPPPRGQIRVRVGHAARRCVRLRRQTCDERFCARISQLTARPEAASFKQAR